MLTVTVALTVTVLGAAKLAGSDGILAAFVAALVYDRLVDPQEEFREAEVQESVKRVRSFDPDGSEADEDEAAARATERDATGDPNAEPNG